MQDYTIRDSAAWTTFTYINFGVGAVMMGIGIWMMEASFSAKGYHAMAALMLVYATAGISKAMRDREESRRMFNRLEEARTEKMLAEAVGEG